MLHTIESILSVLFVVGTIGGSPLVGLLHRMKLDTAANVIAAKLPAIMHTVQVVRDDLPKVEAAPADKRIAVVLDELVADGEKSDNETIVRWASMVKAARGGAS